MRAFKFTFKGFALGGEAIIIAKSYEEACSMIETPFSDFECKNIKGETLNKSKVLHYWTGDY